MSSKKSKSKSSKSSIHPNGNGVNDNQATTVNTDYNYDPYSIKTSSQTSIKGGFSTLVGGFGGYHGTVSADTLSFDASQSIDPQIEFCLKRLLKKDSITKLKALEDLRKLFSTLSIHKLEAAASAWAYAFNKLALVNDKRIRENLHLCFVPFCKQIATSKAKWFTPHLKRIFVYWWMHQHDPSPEVVEAAYDSFYASFGRNATRHWKVVCYVKDTMLNEMKYILDIETTPETLSNLIKKSNKKSKKKGQNSAKNKGNKGKKADRASLERYERTIASTLCGLATLIAKENEMDTHTNDNDNDAFQKKRNKTWFETYRPLLCDINLWRFINDRSPLLRNSAYLLCASCLGSALVTNEILPLISATLFRCMSETYVPNMDNLWTALLAMIQYENSWKYAKKKSFIIRLSNLVQVDIFSACKYIRSFLLFIPSNYLFESVLSHDYDMESGADSDKPKSKKKKKKKKSKHKLVEDENVYPICRVLKAIWSGALNISHLSKRFKAVTIIYLKIILQLLLKDNNAKCDDGMYVFDAKVHPLINKMCKEMIMKDNVLGLICKSIKDLECPSLFFELFGEHFMPKIVEYDEQILIDYFASLQRNDIKVDDETSDIHMDEIVKRIQNIRDNEYYNTVVVESVNCVFHSIQNECMEPFCDLMALVMDQVEEDEQQEIADKTEDFVSDYQSGLNKVSSFVVYLKPFIYIENILYQHNTHKREKLDEKQQDIKQEPLDGEIEDDMSDDDDVMAYWNRKNSVKFCVYELMNEIWDFQSNVELMINTQEIANTLSSEPEISLSIPTHNIDTDSEDEDDHEEDDDIKTNFAQLYVKDPNEMGFNVCKSSLFLIKNIIQILSIDFGATSSDTFELDTLLNQDIMEGIENILCRLQTKIPIEHSAGLMSLYLQITNIILNKGKDNDNNPLCLYLCNDNTYDTTKHWKTFLKQISNYEWSLKNVSVFMDNILLQNSENIRNNKTLLIPFESFITHWISAFLNVDLSNNIIMSVSTTNNKLIPSESYTSLIISLQRLLGGTQYISSHCLLSILSLIVRYLNAAIAVARNPHNVSFPGITKNKTHAVIRSLSLFLEQNWRNNTDKDCIELSKYQLLIVSKLFTLCFARDDSGDPQNIATICEYLFKKIVRYHTDLYGELLEVIAKSLRLPWYFTSNSTDGHKDVPQYYYPSFIDENEQKDDTNRVPIVINRCNPSRWRWCVQCLLLLQSTSFEHGLHLINIILDRKDLEYIFSLALSDGDDSLKILTEFGVSLCTLQRVRDVVCDLSDLIGMELVLYEPSENSHFSLLSQEQIALSHREWLVCWLLSFEEKLSWLPLLHLPDPSIIEHTKQWKIEMAKYHSIQDNTSKSSSIHEASLGRQHSISNKSASQPSARHLFAKPRTFCSVFELKLTIQYQTSHIPSKVNKNERNPLQFQQKQLFCIPQKFLDDCIIHAADTNRLTFYCKTCPMGIRSRVVGYFVNALNDRMAVYNYHRARYLDNGLRTFVSKLFANYTDKTDDDEEAMKALIDNIQIMQSVFVMFPDLIPISFIRRLIALSTECRINISNLTTALTEKHNENTRAFEIERAAIIKQLRLLYELLRPIHGIALNITSEYKPPVSSNNIPDDDHFNVRNENDTDDREHPQEKQDKDIDITTTSYPTSMIWVKHRELLVGTLFELFLYLNGSFEWFLQQVEHESQQEATDFNNDVFFWFSSSLTLISHSLIGMNSEGEEDVFFELDWSSLIFVSNFVMDHILHQRTEFTLCLHSYLSEFYQFLLLYSKPNMEWRSTSHSHPVQDITILNNIDEEYRYNMMTLWHCMAVLRQIALRSRDLSGRKNLKTKRNKSFIFESLELLTEILGNEIWRNILSAEALASPFHKLSLKELEVEQLVYLSYVNTSDNMMSSSSMNFMIHSGIICKSLSAISEQNELLQPNDDESYVNITPSYQTHAILDELYHSINDLLSHPVVMSSVNNSNSALSPSSCSSSDSGHNLDNIHRGLSSILQSWHYQLFDALGSSHHQIAASAFRLLSISTRYQVLKNMNLFTKKTDRRAKQKGRKGGKGQSPMPEIEEEKEVDNEDTMNLSDLPSDIDLDDEYDDSSDAMSVVSTTSYAASVSFAMSSSMNSRKSKYEKNVSNHISLKDRARFQRINNLINSIIPTMYLLPHNTRSFVQCHELRSWFLCWYLFMDMVEEVPLEFKLEIVQTMKHDDKYTSPLGSYALALREIIEHVYIAESLPLLMNNYVTKINEIANKQSAHTHMHQQMFEFAFDLSDFCTNLPSDDPNISANMLSRCRWLHNLTGNVFNKNIFFSRLAIRVYDRLLSYFPALCRYWATNDVKDRVTRNIVSKITSSQFSPIILSNIFNSKKLNRTLKSLRKNDYNNSTFRLDDNVILKLKCNWQTREIEALYICDEVSISMVVLYPFDYPLKGVTFEWRETCGLPPKKVKNWKMLLMGMVNNQNATITQAFMLLAINISKHYQGIDECPICYSVVHPTKKTLPKVKCTTCKGKFHRYCIYKWTKTSQKSSCPLCRSLI